MRSNLRKVAPEPASIVQYPSESKNVTFSANLATVKKYVEAQAVRPKHEEPAIRLVERDKAPGVSPPEVQFHCIGIMRAYVVCCSIY